MKQRQGCCVTFWAAHRRTGRSKIEDIARTSAPGTADSPVFTPAPIEVILGSWILGVRGFGGRHAPMMSPRQPKEVIHVAHINVGSIASLGALVGGGVSL